MPLLPIASVERRGTEPFTPSSGIVFKMPRQIGADGVLDEVEAGVRVADTVLVAVRVVDALPEPVADAVPVLLSDGVLVEVLDCAKDRLGVTV